MSDETSQDRLAKIRIELPNEEWPKGESFWAESLGGALYRLDNIPFHAYDLHLGDVVRAVPPGEGDLPNIVEVVERSGQRTVRIFFPKETPDADVARIVDEVDALAGKGERAFGKLYAYSVGPDRDYEGLLARLDELERAGLLFYETGMTGRAET